MSYSAQINFKVIKEGELYAFFKKIKDTCKEKFDEIAEDNFIYMPSISISKKLTFKGASDRAKEEADRDWMRNSVFSYRFFYIPEHNLLGVFGVPDAVWVKRGNGEGWFNHEILADALALINSQEQRIEELEAENRQYDYKQRKLIEERDVYKTWAYNKNALINSMTDKIEKGYEPSAARACAEAEMWQRIALREKELTEENERLREHNITLEQKLMLLGIDDVYVFKAKVKGE